ncbi:hypothetical protein BGW37DRAFT_516416 [Umbelopsis sp. PMI_123]|jgi:predicted GNAT family acetyltransferase|nr:hypothetical protein BGW37DRAFT_516416 [Umbelopsis sp. PMI_123]
MSNLSVKVYSGPQHFLDELRSQLEEHELENCQVIFKPKIWARDGVDGGYYAAVLDGDKLLYAACWAPGNHLWLSWSPEDGGGTEEQELLAKHVATVDIVVKGVRGYMGCEPGAKTFTSAYAAATNQMIQVHRSMYTYKLIKVRYPDHCQELLGKGELRQATVNDDMKLIGNWYKGYNMQCKLPMPSDDECETAVTNLTKVGLLYLFVLENQPVSMAFQLRPLTYGTSVAGVYTPPEFRKRGYGSVLMATFGEHLLKTFQFVTLHADKYNPTSNHIYQDVGYEYIRDTNDYEVLRSF